VAWRSIRNGNEEVRVANVDGSAMRNLTRHPALDHAPAWSPNGRRIAFASTRGNTLGIPHVWVMNADGTNAHVLTRAFTGKYPAWSPDGKRIVFAPTGASARTGSTSSSLAPTGRTRTGSPGTTSEEMGASWSPDGKWIAFYAGSGGSHDLYLIRPDGSGWRRLTHGGGEMPSWSPDGRSIAYAAPAGLVVIRPDGTEVARLSTGLSGGNFASWARQSGAFQAQPPEAIMTRVVPDDISR
jgi:TolB protein